MTDKTNPEGFHKRQATEPDGISSKNRVTGDDDVEGHRYARTTEPVGISSKNRVTGDDDVEGHLSRQRVDGEGFARAKVDGEGFARAKASGEDDDVEGHSLLDPFAARELARARERDVQQHAKRHEFERDARDAKKDRS